METLREAGSVGLMENAPPVASTGVKSSNILHNAKKWTKISV